MKKFILVAIAALSFAFAANASQYTVDDSAIDALVESAVEAAPAQSNASASASIVSSRNEGVALALNFVLGGLGIHRHYMGTANWMWAAYLCTFGGICGIVPTVDFIVMLIDLVSGNGLGAYFDNTKFLMWL